MERGSRHVMVSPRRDDRFLAGSRYGKRNDLLGTNPVDGQPIAVHGPDKDMDCLYTGVSDLYRCVIRSENYHILISTNVCIRQIKSD